MTSYEQINLQRPHFQIRSWVGFPLDVNFVGETPFSPSTGSTPWGIFLMPFTWWTHRCCCPQYLKWSVSWHCSLEPQNDLGRDTVSPPDWKRGSRGSGRWSWVSRPWANGGGGCKAWATDAGLSLFSLLPLRGGWAPQVRGMRVARPSTLPLGPWLWRCWHRISVVWLGPWGSFCTRSRERLQEPLFAGLSPGVIPF